jgi:hypothetical protein
MKLIYRATTINHQPQSLPAYRQPNSINWRYRQAGQIFNEMTEQPVYHQPRAINWCYCPSL